LIAASRSSPSAFLSWFTFILNGSKVGLSILDKSVQIKVCNLNIGLRSGLGPTEIQLHGVELADLFRCQADLFRMFQQMFQVVSAVLVLLALTVAAVHLTTHHPSLALICKAGKNCCRYYQGKPS